MWAAPRIPSSVMWFFWRLWSLCAATGNYYLADEFRCRGGITGRFGVVFFHLNRPSVWVLPGLLEAWKQSTLCVWRTVLARLCCSVMKTFKTGWKNWLKLLHMPGHAVSEQPAFFGQRRTRRVRKASWWLVVGLAMPFCTEGMTLASELDRGQSRTFRKTEGLWCILGRLAPQTPCLTPKSWTTGPPAPWGQAHVSCFPRHLRHRKQSSAWPL